MIVSDAIGLYGKMLVFSRLTIMSTDWQLIQNSVEQFNHGKLMPVVIESEQMLELDKLIKLLWANNIAVIGVIDGVLTGQAKNRQMAVFPSDGKRIDRLDDRLKRNSTSDASVLADTQAIDNTSSEQAKSEKTACSAMLSQTTASQTIASQSTASQSTASQSTALDLQSTKKMDVVSHVHHQMVRSGQSVHYMGGDLVIIGSVNVGAEVVTDYNLHIYGKGQGRLVAGATGDENARIFCQKFDPSLVSVAGTYCLKDDIPAEVLGGAVEVRFDKEKGLVFSKMTE